MSVKSIFIGAALLGLGMASANATVITQYTGYGDFTSGTTFFNNFESSASGPHMTPDGTAFLADACTWASCVTPSGSTGLGEFADDAPLSISFDVDVFEIGFMWGNDDFELIFDAFLSVYDEFDNLLGTVSLTSNGNDFADQFLGLHSDTAIRRMEFSFARPDAGNLAVYMDDLLIGVGNLRQVPEPTSLALLGLGLLGLVRRRRV